MVSGSFSSCRLRVERLTATLMSTPALCQAASWASAASKLQRVKGWISPVCSACGMNSSGRMAPWAGWRQRASASTLWIVPPSRSSLG